MNKTNIEWCDYTINPVKGLCPMACEYCYARRMYKRFKWSPEIRYTAPGFTIADIQSIKKPSRIFVGSTMELFWDWPEIWLRDTFTIIIRQFPQHTFIFLTKQPQNLAKWSPFPDNCWVGVTATDHSSFAAAMNYLWDLEATMKFISFEPLLGKIPSTPRLFLPSNANIGWLILGQQTPTSAKTQPRLEWIREIVEAADKAGIPVFLKNNLRPLFKLGSIGYDMDCFWHISEDGMTRSLRQEMPA